MDKEVNYVEGVRSIVSEFLELDGELVNAKDDFSSLGLDSLDWIEIIMAVEEKYEIEIPDEEGERMTSAFAIAEFVEKAKQQK